MTVQNKYLLHIFIKAILFTFLFVAALSLLSLVGLFGFAYHQFSIFATEAHTSLGEVRSVVSSGLQTPVEPNNNQVNFLILGVDSLDNRGEAPPLTDTMMLVSLHLQTGKISMLSLPRDLWSDDYQTKINALYAYGSDRYPERPELFPTEVISAMTNQPIQYSLVISMDQVAEIIDLLGGIEVEVTEGFTDSEFPRSDVNIQTERDPAVLYKTVTFETGKQILNGERALEFIRSRHSSGDQGNDIARSLRQQQVMTAVMTTLKQRKTITNPVVLGKLYAYYQQRFAQILPMTQLVAIAKVLFPVRNQIELQQNQISVYPDDPEGIIYHPPSEITQNVWVYQIRDKQLFQEKIKEQL